MGPIHLNSYPILLSVFIKGKPSGGPDGALFFERIMGYTFDVGTNL
mgnify:CR=1 FL=1